MINQNSGQQFSQLSQTEHWFNQTNKDQFKQFTSPWIHLNQNPHKNRYTHTYTIQQKIELFFKKDKNWREREKLTVKRTREIDNKMNQLKRKLPRKLTSFWRSESWIRVLERLKRRLCFSAASLYHAQTHTNNGMKCVLSFDPSNQPERETTKKLPDASSVYQFRLIPRRHVRVSIVCARLHVSTHFLPLFIFLSQS